MHAFEAADDLRRTLSVIAHRQAAIVAIVQIDIALGLDDGLLGEFEQFLDGSMGPYCWRLGSRYVGVYRGNGDVRPKAEQLRKDVEARRFASGRRLTVSVGLSMPRQDLGLFDQLLRAERALLAAREEGGNRVLMATKQSTSKAERARLGRRRP